MNTHIIGWGHTPFRHRDGEDVESPRTRAIDQALLDAGVEARDIDEICLGHFNGGFAPQGRTCREGGLPVNLSGGLKFKGHPFGATGVSMHVMAAMQLPGAHRAGVFNMGGSGVARACSRYSDRLCCP